MTNFHDGGAKNWNLSRTAIDFMVSLLPDNASTLETGAGASTLAFAKHGLSHTAITPSADEVSRIKEHGAASGIDLSRVTFRIAPSQDVLPTLNGPIDFLLIDGGHGFPIPQIDWFYGSQLLKVGGIVAVDDIHTWTGAILNDFLACEPGWHHIKTIERKTAFFRMTKPFEYAEWDRQPFVLSRSKTLIAKRKFVRFFERLVTGNWKIPLKRTV